MHICDHTAAQRAMSQLNVEIGKCQEVEATLKGGMESGVRKLHAIEVRIRCHYSERIMGVPHSYRLFYRM
jgi:hypothetical protein